MIYGVAMLVRRAWYRSGLLRVHKAPMPVISVGNLTVGGTGKTPMVQYLAQGLLARKKRVVVASRGYRGAEDGLNDEARLLREAVPEAAQVLHPVRTTGLALAKRRWSPDVAVLDDGFQHRSCARNVDIVLIDALQPFGGCHVLPLGRMREWPRALRAADVLLVTRADQVSDREMQLLHRRLRGLAPGALVLPVRFRPVAVHELDGKPMQATCVASRRLLGFCGIGNPAAFRRTLEGLGADLRGFQAFADHQAYEQKQIDQLCAEARKSGAEGLITTHKDAVKLNGLRFSLPCYWLSIGAEVGDADKLWELVESRL